MTLDYSPVGIEDDEDELLRNRGYAPVAPAVDPTLGDTSGAGDLGEFQAARGYAPVTPLGELRSAVTHPVQSAEDAVRGSVQSAVGSTRDLEGRLAHPREAVQDAMRPSAEAPEWAKYKPVEPHGWSRFGHAMASLLPQTNEYFNVAPERRAEQSYKAANEEYERPLAEQAKEAEAEKSESEAEKNRQAVEDAKHPKPVKDPFALWMEQNPDHPVSGFFKAQQEAKPDQKPDSIDQRYDQAIASGDHAEAARLLKVKADLARAGQAPERPEKPPRQMIIGPDGKVIELHPGDVVPQGSKTVTGELTNKPTADEQRRADLSENLNENFDQLEDILKRRPELFGKAAGRLTSIRSWIGSDDPDIAALGALKHQIGMAQISAHGMRSAQGVESAAESLVDSWKNSAEATKNALEKARDSVKTFRGDVERAKAGGEKNPKTQAFTDGGVTYHIPADKVDAFKKDHPNAK